MSSAKIQRIGKSTRLEQNSVKPTSLENGCEDLGSPDHNHRQQETGNPSSVWSFWEVLTLRSLQHARLPPATGCGNRMQSPLFRSSFLLMRSSPTSADAHRGCADVITRKKLARATAVIGTFRLKSQITGKNCWLLFEHGITITRILPTHVVRQALSRCSTHSQAR